MTSINQNILLFCVLLLTACSQAKDTISSDDAPQWIQGEPDMYPNTQYLTATGSASSLEQAKARALSNLAKIFEVQIREVSSTKQDVQSNKVAGEETVNVKQQLKSTVNLQTDEMIQGARIAEQWQSSADLTYYALAVLDRKQAGNNIRSEMRSLDEDTQYALSQHEKRNDRLLKIADLNTANQLQRDRQTLQKTLKIIDVSGQGSPANWQLAELDERLQQALRALPLQTKVTQDDIGKLDSILQGAVSKAGFQISSSAAGSYVISSSMTTQKPFKKNNWYWLRGSLSIELIAEIGNTVLGQESWPLKVSANSESALVPRMRKAVEEKLDQVLFDSMLEFASGS